MQGDTCYVCRKQGHWSWHCPSKSSSPNLDPNIPSQDIVQRMKHDICYTCKKRGHWSWYCPSKSPSSKYDSDIPSQDIVERMKHDICYTCQKRGHWSWHCPSKSSSSKYDSDIPSQDIVQRMKHDICYTCDKRGHWSWYCPSKSPSPNYVSYIPSQDRAQLPNPHFCYDCNKREHWSLQCPYKSPSKPISPYNSVPKHESPISSKLIRGNDPIHESDLQPLLFLPQARGSCDRVSEDDLLDSKSIVPMQQSRGKSVNDFLEGCQNNKIDDEFGNKLCKTNDLQVQIKWMGITYRYCSGNPSSMFIIDIPNKEGAGSSPKGWLGRLLFFYPTQSLKFSTPKPFFFCVFPSYNPIIVPKQTSILDGLDECNLLAISSVSQHTKLSAGFYTKASGDVVRPSKSQDSERKPITSKAQRNKEGVLFAQQRLLIDLETLDRRKHESMENSLTLEKHNKLFKKMMFAKLREELVTTEALLEASKRHKQLLSEQVIILKAMLHEKQHQLKFCEMNTLKIETQLDDLKRSMLETDIRLKERVEQTEVTNKHSEERQAMGIAAKTTLEMARLELEN